MTRYAVRSTCGGAAAGQHSRIVLLIGSTPPQSLFFCATRRLERRSLLSHCFSFAANHVPMYVTGLHLPAGYCLLLQCSTYTMTWPLPSSRPLLKDLSTGACSISNSIRFPLENLLHLLMVGGSPLCAFLTTSFFYTRQKRGRILPRNSLSLPTFL